MYVLSYLLRRKSIITIECRKKRAKAINGDRIFKKIFCKREIDYEVLRLDNRSFHRAKKHNISFWGKGGKVE